MRLPLVGLGHSLPLTAGLLATWLLAACLVGGSAIATAPGASAQGTVTPPAGQPRVTAPGGRRGRAARHQRPRHRHR
jgi:hypothetical protein